MVMHRAAVSSATGPGSVSRQSRCFFPVPDVPSSMRLMFSQHFRGRGAKKRDQVFGSYEETKWLGNQRAMGATDGPARQPDLDDPRPPIIGWHARNEDTDYDGTLPLEPYEEPMSDGRKVMQGMYCDFRELYNQHYTNYPIYGGGAWDPRRSSSCEMWADSSASLVGALGTEKQVYIYPNVVIRADLNKVVIRAYCHIMDGTVLTTDGHPRNTHKPGRISRINEGPLFIGSYSIVHPNCTLDSCTLGGYNEVGEGCKLGNGSVMEKFSSLEPGSVLLANQRVPRFEIWGGNPARKMGYRDRDHNKWIGKLDQLNLHYGLSHIEETNVQGGDVSLIRSSEKMQDALDARIESSYGRTPNKVREYVERFTPEIPLWEIYKNLTRMNTRPGIRRDFSWNMDPKKARWIDHH